MENNNPESKIFCVSLKSYRRLMIYLGILPYRNYLTHKRGFHCKKVSKLSLHLLAVFTLTGFLINEHVKRLQEVIYNVDDIFSSVMDGLGFISLITVQLIVHLESTWKSQMYQNIFNKFEQMRTLLLQKFEMEFDFPKLKSCVKSLRNHFAIYSTFLLFFVVLLALQPIPTVRFLVCLHAEIVLKIKIFEFMYFTAVFMVMLGDLCRAAKKQRRLLEDARFENKLQQREYLLGFIALQDLHALLWENLQLLTDYFEWSLPGLLGKQLSDLTLLAYWAFLNIERGTSIAIRYYLIVIWLIRISTLTLACYLCTMCERRDRELRSYFRNCLKDRRNQPLMKCLHRISMQLWQEPITFDAGNFVTINIGTLGKYLFTVSMYIVILIQFRLSV